MNKGRIVFSGEPQALAADTETCRQYLGLTKAKAKVAAAAGGA
jgi:hypothetical protein